MTNFPLPSQGSPFGITKGPNGNIWFTEPTQSRIGTVTVSGNVANYQEFNLAPGTEPYGIAAGPDGALWFTQASANKIGRITVTGTVTEYSVPTPNARPTGIVAGTDGAMWFTEFRAGKLGRIAVGTGTITEFPTALSARRAFGNCHHRGRRAVVHRIRRQQDWPVRPATPGPAAAHSDHQPRFIGYCPQAGRCRSAPRQAPSRP